MIEIDCASPINTVGIREIAASFAEALPLDMRIKVIFNEGYIEMSCGGVRQRVINDGAPASLKLCAYMLFSVITSRTLPWGSLSGVKPVKLMMNRIEEGCNKKEAFDSMKLKYMVSDEKLEVMWQCAQNQKYLLYPRSSACALYIHIPLCPSICSYCSFPSCATSEGSELCQKYVQALITELNAVDEMKGANYYDCVYIGGGTPSVLSMEQIEMLMNAVNRVAPHAKEITFEAGRADTTTKEKLQLLKQLGVSRISLNPQSVHDETLSRVKRPVSFEKFLYCYENAVNAGHDDINCDLIFGLSGENEKMFDESLARIIALFPSAITLHSLCAKHSAEIERSETAEHSLNVISYMDKARDSLRRYGYLPYYLYRQKYAVSSGENTGYCAPGRQCVYNIRMMGDTQSIFSAGAASTTKLYYPKDNRFESIYNIKEMSLYINNISDVIQKKLSLMQKFGELHQ